MTGTALFDLDGTLVDADHLHHEAWRQVLVPFKIDLTVENYRSEIMGFANAAIAASILPDVPLGEAARIIDDKEKRFRALATQLDPAPGLLVFLDWLKQRQIPVGVVTNAPRLNAEQELRGIGLFDYFPVVVIGEELAHSKPHPLPYLTGLERLAGTASRSVAFEDSISGIRSAKAAGLAVIGLTTGHPAAHLMAEGAGLAIADFTDARLLPFVQGCCLS
jgi:HAD superfamily hydrolase (TIGR01509 family)